MLDLWYKNAVIYCLDVDTFVDSNGDGIGDFQGLADRLDHIEALGATCIWLMPFYPSPNRDNGYDVTDYYGVDPKLGSLGDLVQFTHAAHDRGLRIIVDLVVNHTSVDHPWFQSARKSPDSPYRDWYVWSKDKPENAHEGMVFPGVQDSTWTYDDEAGAWYQHRFFAHQPDLNIANPAVREEIARIMGFWLKLGVSGFRVDAVPFLIEYRGLDPEDRPKEDPHEYLEEMRHFLAWRRAESMLLAEANITMDQVDEYFGDGNRLHTIFNFPLNQNLFLALARQTAAPLQAFMGQMPPLPDTGQWATFLRNHDELDLGRLSDEEREEVFRVFAPEKSMQIFERGIRRRLAPMLGDERRIKMAYSMMFALPGTPVLYYGEEIGMGDDQALPGRNPVRTPMQWSNEPNGGFSTAPTDKLVRPVLNDGPFGYEKVNVADQHDRPGSLMEHIQRLIRVRRSCPEIGRGTWEVVETDQEMVFGLRSSWRGGSVVMFHNFADRRCDVRPNLGGEDLRLHPLFCDGDDREPRSSAEPIPMNPYGFRWFRVHGSRR